MFQITRTHPLTETVFATEIRSAPITNSVKPGQYVKVMVTPDSIPLPVPVVDMKPNQGTFVIAAEDKDEARHALRRLEPGDSLADCTGPFGQPILIESVNKVVCIGDGLGAAVIFPHLHQYKSLGCYTISIIGCPAKEDMFWTDRLSAESDEHYLVTEDGSFGIKGRITSVLRAINENTTDLDRVVVSGPLKLMKSIADFTKPLDIPTHVNFCSFVSEKMWREGHIRPAGDNQDSFSFMDKTEINGYLLDFDSLLNQEKQYAQAQTETTGEIPAEGGGQTAGQNPENAGGQSESPSPGKNSETGSGEPGPEAGGGAGFSPDHSGNLPGSG